MGIISTYTYGLGTNGYNKHIHILPETNGYKHIHIGSGDIWV